MKPIPAIVESAEANTDLLVERLVVALREERDAEKSAARHEQLGAAARETAKMRRLEIGRMLSRARSAWPKSGPRAKGWGEFLARIGLDDSTAWRYIDAVKASQVHGGPGGCSSEPASSSGGSVSSQPGSVRENSTGPGTVCSDGARDVTPDDVTPEPAPPPPPTGPEVEIDRDSWCTPPWITEAIGEWDLDPCSNERSTVQSRHRLDESANGLSGAHLTSWNASEMRTFINPPYSDVQPWIAAYKHTRFCFLLKLDTSTKWFAELWAATQLILIPRRRVNFIAPPGVPPEKAIAQQFPHALFYARHEDATGEIHGLSWAWRVR